MKIDWITVRVIGQIIFGFVVGGLIVGLLVGGVLSLLIKDDAPVITKNINEQYYYTQQTSGFATTSTITNIDIYRKRKWLYDKKVGEIDKYVYESEDIQIDYTNNRLIMYVNGKVKVDTLVDMNGDFYVSCEEWLKKEYSIR